MKTDRAFPRALTLVKDVDGIIRKEERIADLVFPDKNALRLEGKCTFCEKLIYVEQYETWPKIYQKEFWINGACMACADWMEKAGNVEQEDFDDM